MHATSARRSRRGIIAAVISVAVVVTVGAVATALILPVIGANGPAEAVTPTVTEEGFQTVIEGGVTVSGGADVAPVGTPVHVNVIEQDIPGDFGTFATPVAPVVDIVIGAGLQPAGPITLAFTFTADQADALDSDSLFVLGESETQGREVDFVEGTWDASTRTMTAEIEHLSWYTVTKVDDESLGRQVGQWIDQQLSVRTAKPECVDEPIQPSGAYVLATPWPDAAWVCARETTSKVTVSLQSNSGLVYQIATRPTGEYAPLASVNVSGMMTTYVARLVEEQWNALEGDGVLLAGGDMDITFDKPFDSAYIEIKMDPALSQISSIVFGTSMLLPVGWQDALDWAGCGASALEMAAGSSAGPTVLSCVSAGAKGAAGKLLGILTSGPAMLATQLQGLGKTATGENIERFTVSLVAGDALREPPAGAAWLFEQSRGGTSTSGDEEVATLPGANSSVASYPFSTNQWVGCTSTPAQGRYTLDGKWTRLTMTLALQDFAPAGMTASMEVLADGKMLFSGPVTRGTPVPLLDLDVSGAQELTVKAITNDDCGSAPKGYATLGQAYLR